MSLLSCSEGENNLLAPGISEELANYRKSTIDSIVYDLRFNIPPGKDAPVTGEARISFALKNNAEDVILDFNASSDKIKQVKSNGEVIDIWWEQEHLIIPAAQLQLQNTIHIQFEAGEQSLNRYEDYLYTLFVPERASTCFPVFDQPDLKARYKLALTVPKGWQAVANGPVTSIEENGDAVSYYFAETKPISSYLFSFAAGDFKVVTRDAGGREMRMLHRETDSAKVNRNVDAIFEWHAKSLQWLEEYTGIPYPFEKFDFVLIPSFQYGGMEHPGAILYSASTLFLDESSTLNQELGRARLIAHETAHMWFGDLVTMKWFNDVWLKEVFANFIAAKIVNPGFPEVNHDLQFMMAHYPGAYHVDRTRGTHPIQQPLENLKNAGTLYGGIIYQKAPVVMRMLEESTGKDKLQEGLRQYLNTYAFDNASWDDLINILSDDVTFNIDGWNQRWVKSAGMPVVYYRLSSKKKNETLIDKLSIWSRNEYADEVQWWNQDLQILLGYTDSTAIVEANILTDSKSFDLEGMPYPEYLFLNAGGLGYGYFRMGGDSKEHFLKNIDKHQDPVLRGAVWINLFEAMLRRQLDPEKLMSRAMASLPQEKEALIAEYITSIIETIYWRLYSPEQRLQLAPRLEGLLLNMTLHAPTINLKSTYFNILKRIAITDNSVMILKRIWSEEMTLEGLPLAERDFTSLAYELAVREVEGYEDILKHQYENITNPDRKKKFEFIEPALSADETVRDAFFASLRDEKNRSNEAWVLDALSYLHHPLRAQSAVKYIKPGLEMLTEIQLTGDIFFPYRWLDRTLSGHSSEEADNEVRQFLYRHNNYPANLKNKILQTSDMLFRAVEIKNKTDK
ncbi:Membrane alanine aminopeptidase N [Fulvivirga imtechensis AK7]|uniref:Aminopeptidase N n=1 Tax=Fulvivirga imtechensis AK7 TaxID=1237149 RepID=L8K355_9BACT|nr:M1 family aminopeptidase [Fulvivirga imtechensis]ELR73897.1 Membrane alanine aminopeptidase N [Fulvivirga imtechensis AK7]